MICSIHVMMVLYIRFPVPYTFILYGVEIMPFVLIRHKVADFDNWKPIYDSDQERRESLNIKEVDLFRSDEDPNDVHMLFEIPSADAMEQMMSDPTMAEKMQAAGVLSQPTVTLLNKA